MSIISIPFKGAHYMCVEASKRAYALDAANYAYSQGEYDLANALCEEALKLPGCAFEARENESELDDYQSDLRDLDARQKYADACFEAKLENNRDYDEDAWIASFEDIREE